MFHYQVMITGIFFFRVQSLFSLGLKRFDRKGVKSNNCYKVLNHYFPCIHSQIGMHIFEGQYKYRLLINTLFRIWGYIAFFFLCVCVPLSQY